jgi:hypothetical protein
MSTSGRDSNPVIGLLIQTVQKYRQRFGMLYLRNRDAQLNKKDAQ